MCILKSLVRTFPIAGLAISACTFTRSANSMRLVRIHDVLSPIRVEPSKGFFCHLMPKLINFLFFSVAPVLTTTRTTTIVKSAPAQPVETKLETTTVSSEAGKGADILLVPAPTTTTTTSSIQPFSTVLCKFKGRCRNANCTFKHPPVSCGFKKVGNWEREGMDSFKFKCYRNNLAFIRAISRKKFCRMQ